MPFERPPLSQLIEQGATEFESRLPGVLVRVRRSLVGVINRVVAGGLSALYQYAEWLFKQAWPDQSEKEFLDAHGARWGITRTPSTAATGSVTFTGTNGAAVPVGARVQRVDGMLYETTAAGFIVLGTAVLPAIALTPGQAGNADLGVGLTLSSPILNVNAMATASTALSGGADIEKDEPYRSRILERIRKVPQGGALLDYERWAKEVPGVTRVWVSPRELGGSTVVVRFLRDEDANTIPDPGELAAVKAYIDERRPVTAQVYVFAPIDAPIDFSIALTPDTPAVRAAVVAELQAMLQRDAEPGATILLSHIREAISIAAGEVNHVLYSPTADVVHATGRMPSMGDLSWM